MATFYRVLPVVLKVNGVSVFIKLHKSVKIEVLAVGLSNPNS